MHVRVTNRRRGDKVYRSVQIVQSYRRPDGMPAQRVLATFGDLSELETENLRAAIKAGRDGKAVVVADLPSRAAPRVKRNLRYADVAAAWRTWRAWDLSSLVDELVGPNGSEVPFGDAVGALVVQRCVEPRSKLAAVDWFPNTALPEITGINPAQFHNTRIHRVLEALDKIEAPLQERLAKRLETRAGAFVHLFLDCTDAWFVGDGPDLAHNRKTKEGLLRRQVGIVLLCDQRGFPLRWATLPGNHDEGRSMFEVLTAAAQLDWAHQRPFVMDRAMGHGATVAEMVARGIRFVTAVPAHEVASYSGAIPLGSFDAVPLTARPVDLDEVRAELVRIAEARGFEAIGRGRFAIDLGVFPKTRGAGHDHLFPSKSVATLKLGRSFQAEIRRGAATAEELAKRHGIGKRSLHRWIALTALAPTLQARVLAGEADRLSYEPLLDVARLPESEQEAAFQDACAAVAEGSPLRATAKMLEALGSVEHIDIRGVVVFKPDHFIEQRSAAERRLARVRAEIAALDAKAATGRRRYRSTDLLTRAGTIIRRAKLADVLQAEVETVKEGDRDVPRVRLALDEAAWRARRQTDGLTLIVTHPDVPGSAREVVELYFAKDQVEKDFQTIKSVVKLRPVRHYTDAKVRAHVTLCTLALLVERSIEQSLIAADEARTAASTFDILKSLHLNLFDGEPAVYTPTLPSPDQQRLLAALNMLDLVDEASVAEQLTHR